MAVAIPKQTGDVDEIGDITNNLPSLQFESALSDAEKQLLVLRKRSHALTVAACAQATYYVSVLNEARQISIQLKQPAHQRVSRLLQEGAPKDPLKIGVIGCGRLGSHLVNCMLTFGEVNPSDIKVSTRRPEMLTELQEKGVICMYDNAAVANSSHVLFLCILPSQLPLVAEEIHGKISTRCLVYSMLSSVTVSRLKQLLDFSNVIRPEFSWNTESLDPAWDYTLDMGIVFSSPTLLQQTCPLYLGNKDTVIHTEDSFAEALIFAFINMCTMLRLSRKDTVDMINAILLGENSKEPLVNRITEEDIACSVQENVKSFPKFDLTTILGKDKPLTQKLVNSEEVREAFVNRYCDVFAQYLQWKNNPLRQDRR